MTAAPSSRIVSTSGMESVRVGYVSWKHSRRSALFRNEALQTLIAPEDNCGSHDGRITLCFHPVLKKSAHVFFSDVICFLLSDLLGV